MIEWKVENFLNGISVAVFNDGYSRMTVDDHCWVLKNGDGSSPHIFKEAAEVLKQLPNSPDDYQPYFDFLWGEGKNYREFIEYKKQKGQWPPESMAPTAVS